MTSEEKVKECIRNAALRFIMEEAINSLKNKMKVKIKKLDHNAIMPTKAHATDAGFDLYCTSMEVNWGTRL